MSQSPHQTAERPPVEPRDSRARMPVMADVAKLAGVSHQTVSRVLNGHPSVSGGARERVQQAIVALGYRRNSAARALVSRRSMTLGVVSVDTSHYGPANTLFGIAEAARAANYYVNLATLKHVDRGTMRAAMEHMVMGVDGIIVIAPLVAAAQAVHGFDSDVPLVMLSATDVELPSVVVDQALGAQLATRHLLELGHQSVVHLSGPEGWYDAELRIRGWRAELSAAKLPAPEIVEGDWTAQSGYDAGREIARRGDVTSVFAANDQMALGLIKALREHGLSVPQDVSIVGFDDVPEAAFFEPAMTTIRQDFAAVGRQCIAQILALIDRRPALENGAIKPELIVRASTAPAAR